MSGKRKKIGIVLLATNAYFVLGLRFIRRWMHYYEGEYDIEFHFFSDTDPKDYLPFSSRSAVVYHPTYHARWVDGTNFKFKALLSVNNPELSGLFYFDADTNIKRYFKDWFYKPGKLSSGEHYSNRTTLANGVGFDRNKGFNSYVPKSSTRPYTYCYGAFFGGETPLVINMMTQLLQWQSEDQARGYEPPVNDESYINKYFHYNDNFNIPTEDFMFSVSDKGGLGNTRIMSLDIKDLKKRISLNKDVLWDIQHGNFYIQDERL